MTNSPKRDYGAAMPWLQTPAEAIIAALDKIDRTPFGELQSVLDDIAASARRQIAAEREAAAEVDWHVVSEAVWDTVCNLEGSVGPKELERQFARHGLVVSHGAQREPLSRETLSIARSAIREQQAVDAYDNFAAAERELTAAIDAIDASHPGEMK